MKTEPCAGFSVGLATSSVIDIRQYGTKEVARLVLTLYSTEDREAKVTVLLNKKTALLLQEQIAQIIPFLQET